MKFFLFCIFSVILCSTSLKGFATDRTFTGTDANWHTASNWSPSGVPGTSDMAFIPANKAVTVSSNTNVGAINIDGTNAHLTVNSGVTLTISGSPVIDNGYYCKIVINNAAELINNGTIDFSLSADIEALIVIKTTGNVTNNTSGAITHQGPASRVSSKAIFNDNGTILNNGLIDINCSTSLITMRPGGEATNASTGTITGSSAYIIDMDQGNFNNYGVVKKSGVGQGNTSVPSGSTFTNYSCARLITGKLEIGGLISNSGYLIASDSFSGAGSITNNGVYISTGSATITNNKLIVNNSTPIFSYGASNDFTIDGIYKDASALVSAGTFTAPNAFTPVATLPVGSQTLYAKVTAAGGSCSYTVPFSYNYVPCISLSASPGNVSVTWTGAESTDWNVPCNWSPAWVPDAASNVVIPAAPVNQPTITANTAALAYTVEVRAGAKLTISNTSTLTVNGTSTFVPRLSFSNGGTVQNNGKIMIGNTSVLGVFGIRNTGNFFNSTDGEIKIDRFSGKGLFNSGTFTNAAKITIGENGESNFETGLENQGTFYNNAGGEIQIDRSTRFGLFNEVNSESFHNRAKIIIGSLANVGLAGLYNSSSFINETGGEIIIDRGSGYQLLNDGTLSNAFKITVGTNFNSTVPGIQNWLKINNDANGEIIVQRNFYNNEGYSPGTVVFNNDACAKLTILNGNLINEATYTINNSGLIQINGGLQNTGTFNNTGLLSYNSISGIQPVNATDASIIVNNSQPIFTYGGTFDGTINGIFTNEDATVSAGVFTAPNSFTPSETLPVGSQKLFAKITPASGGCEFIVSFTYQMTALPVTLISFTGKKLTENQNSLTWVTADEKAFGYFEILRSSDARSFESIGRVSGTENKNSSLKSYNFIDNLARGYNYYRLKMVDRAANGQDGPHELSKIISIANSVENTVVGSLYPNPSKEMVYVDIYTEQAGNWNITLFNRTGTILRNETRILKKGMNKVKLDQFHQGINLIRLENGNVSEIRKVLRE
ncbi:T9SS type A sorting domain-containing protein [Dyadobacter sp. 32]|uniref:T9SS type A sorting domain-containing protein n=1 Tax=Dyadobacter sp. 32 TaxID=538966 RepID=UPI0011EF9AFB